METEALIDLPSGAGGREVEHFFRVHGDEHLDQGEDAGEDSLVQVLADLIDGLARRDARALELDVDQWHAVDEQHHVATADTCQFARRGELGLLRDLVPRLASGNLLRAEDLEGYLLATVELIVCIVSRNGHGLAVDESVKFQRGSQGRHLLQDLGHLRIGKGAAVQAIDVVVVFEDNGGPVVYELFLGGVPENSVLVIPAVVLEIGDECLFELGFVLENHAASFSGDRAWGCVVFRTR